MADRPIIFSGPMVRALLDGRKTMTRRVLKPQPEEYRNEYCRRLRFFNRAGRVMADVSPEGPFDLWLHTPYAPGDRLWVRETWTARMTHGWTIADARSRMYQQKILYRADGDESMDGWWPSIHMPREFSRLTLIVTDVRVQRAQDISEEDAKAEGIYQQSITGWFSVPGIDGAGTSARAAFALLWNSINAKRGYGWDANPWVVALTFRVINRNIDAIDEAESAISDALEKPGFWETGGRAL